MNKIVKMQWLHYITFKNINILPRKEYVDREWGFVKETLASIEQSSHSSKILTQAFNSDKIELCKKFSSQSKELS